MLDLEEYKKQFIKRYDYAPYLKYFSYKDFKGLNFNEYNIEINQNRIMGGFYFYNKIYEPLVVFVHGMGPGHLSYMRDVETIARQGYMVYAYDMFGTGKSDGYKINGLLGAIASLDLVLENLHQTYENVIVIGHSLGAFASLNIAKYKPYIKTVVAISGFVAIDLLSSIAVEPQLILDYEKSLNAKYYESSAEVISKLEKFKGNLMIIHSSDDEMVNHNIGINYLKKHLKSEPNYLMLDGKKHNPNYSYEAVKYMDDVFKDFNNKQKENSLSLDEQIKYFESIDFVKMTNQDMDVWNKIFDFIKL